MSVPRALVRGLTKKSAKKKLVKSDRLSKSLRKAPVRWRIPPSKRRMYESIFEDAFGPKPRGVASWSVLAERYPERFKDYVASNDEEE